MFEVAFSRELVTCSECCTFCMREVLAGGGNKVPTSLRGTTEGTFDVGLAMGGSEYMFLAVVNVVGICR
jgi:hypothetical protein